LKPLQFFREVRRQRSAPFWIHEQLTLRPEYRPTETQDCLPGDDTEISNDLDEDPNIETVDENPSCSDTEEDIDPEAVNEDQLVYDSEEDIDPTPDNNQLVVESDSDDDEIASFISDAEKWIELIRDQKAKGNRRFLRKVMESSRGVRTLVQEISSIQQQRTMPRTWGSRKHPASMYFI
jgi:hypothetical protein